MAANLTQRGDVLRRTYGAAVREELANARFLRRLRRRLAKLERQGDLRERVLEDLSRMVRRVG